MDRILTSVMDGQPDGLPLARKDQRRTGGAITGVIILTDTGVTILTDTGITTIRHICSRPYYYYYWPFYYPICYQNASQDISDWPQLRAAEGRNGWLQEQVVNPLLCISERYFLAHGIGSKDQRHRHMTMQCLVCTGAARDLTPKNFDGYVIECPRCGNYEVAGGAWDRFRNASQQERAAALGKAASLKGVARWPTIKSTCL